MHIRLFIFTCLLFLFQQQPAAQETPKTLLWRISGNGFAKPSYLYGTMHLADKRVYSLGDSVYSSLKFCEGFVMEVDPSDYIDTILSSIEERKIEGAFAYTKKTTDAKKALPGTFEERHRAFDSMMKKMQDDFKDLSPADLDRLRKAYRRRKKNDMKTLLDLYLFDLAKRQGKIMGGLETITNHNSIKDELGNEFNPENFLNKQRKKYADVLEFMIDQYVNADLDQIHAFSLQSQTKRQLSLVLYNRNQQMVDFIDSAGRLRPTFAAAGCAHLPGDSGVIDLLRRKGYIVEPVFSSVKIAPEEVYIENELTALIDIVDSDSNYVVKMPAKPTAYTWITSKLYMKVYKELANDILLMSGFFDNGNENMNAEKQLGEIKNYFTANYEKLSDVTRIKQQGIDGYSMNFRHKEGYINLHMYCNKGKTYLFAAGSRIKDSIFSARCRNYLSGYRMLLEKKERQFNLVTYSCTDKAFEILMPDLPQRGMLETGSKDEEVFLFQHADKKSKISSLFIVKEHKPGNLAGFESNILSETLKEIKPGFLAKYTSEENIDLEGMPALKIQMKGEEEGQAKFLYCIMVLRHNRVYAISFKGLALPETEQLINRMLASFHFLPYFKMKASEMAAPGGTFTVKAASPVFVILKEEGTASSREETSYFLFDSSTALNYEIKARFIGKYVWRENADSLLYDEAAGFVNEKAESAGDSMLINERLLQSTRYCRDVLLKNNQTEIYTRCRFIQHGDSVYTLSVRGAKEMIENENTELFFSSFKFTKETVPTNLPLSKTKLLIEDLKKGKGADFDAAVAALKKGLHFPVADRQEILEAMLFDYPSASEAGSETVPLLLAKNSIPLLNEKSAAFIKANYSLQQTSDAAKLAMLCLLSASDNKSMFDLLKELLAGSPPAITNYDAVLKNLSSNLVLAASLFPAVAVNLGHNEAGPFLTTLAAVLIDSGYMQYSSVLPHEAAVLSTGKKVLQLYDTKNNNDFFHPHTDGVLNMLAKSGQKQARSLLKGFFGLNNIDLNYWVLKAMADNRLPAPEEELDKYCQDPVRRLRFYQELEKKGKLAFFKGQFANQTAFAESYAYLFTLNELPGVTGLLFELVSKKEAVINSKQALFYILKVKCQFAFGNNIFTCIVGPFSTDTSKMLMEEGQEKFILYKERFEPGEIKEYFSDFINKINALENN